MRRHGWSTGWIVSFLTATLVAWPWSAGCRGDAGAGTDAKSKPKDERGRFIRPITLAGSWYPADEMKLRLEIAGYLKDATQSLRDEGAEIPEGRLVALISPHAGYRYSGAVAAYGYSLLKPGQFSRVIVLGPSHHGAFAGVSTPDETHYQTPLGLIEIDREAVEKLRAGPLMTREQRAESVEHSIEIQLPFLQVALGEFQLVPLMVGRLSPTECDVVAQRIRSIVDARTLVVVSSDFTHYGPNYDYVPFPPTPEVAAKIEQRDMRAVRLIRNLDKTGFESFVGKTGATICGRTPIGILMALLQEGTGSVLLKYDSSGRQLNDDTNSVSYVSLAFFAPRAESPPAASSSSPSAPSDASALPSPAPPAAATPEQNPSAGGGASAGDLDPEEMATALKLARASLENHLAPTPADEDVVLGRLTLTEKHKRRAGAFVTLKAKGDLRGCIGTIEPALPLFQAIYQNAIRAASNDPRFPLVTAKELPDISVEVSVLSPLIAIASPEEFEVGKHGILMKKGFAQAVFLPQVAPEQGWGRDETLSHLSRKAGLPADAWKEGAKFWIFTAQVLGEREKGAGK